MCVLGQSVSQSSAGVLNAHRRTRTQHRRTQQLSSCTILYVCVCTQYMHCTPENQTRQRVIHAQVASSRVIFFQFRPVLVHWSVTRTESGLVNREVCEPRVSFRLLLLLLLLVLVGAGSSAGEGDIFKLGGGGGNFSNKQVPRWHNLNRAPTIS